MRLLHVTKLKLKEFFDENVPPYAILSHRWGPDEVSYQDFMGGFKQDGAGYKKIEKCCAYAATNIKTIDLSDLPQRREDIPDSDWVWVVTPIYWVWIDTCCIDKSSSAELSEAINSMYHWYAESRACYAYLSDVTKSDGINQTLSELQNSEWFKRGWTLQELLAPMDLVLLDKNWTELGTRSHLLAHVAQATGIAEERLELCWSNKASGVSVAERFSWAAHRKTTRVEDVTYCLLGLLGQNMPLLYGERDKAFLRLQLEIIRSSNDESVFVWPSGDRRHMGLIAHHPWKFASKYSTQKGEFSKIKGLQRPPYAITNQGLQLRVPAKLSERSSFLLPLNCQHYEGAELKGAYAIPIHEDVSSGIWVRSGPRLSPKDIPQDGSVYRLDDFEFNGLFIVPTASVWSREDLTEENSKVI
ncbi:hypothetical protein GJ744_006300 [Endocarpon pusillum]|uniref:Heterokaryon incompatibility domain-containing protein n=1 Tax=Endocarpon pusillum TaxID=364733 RepID=A0A8H7A422_9EURO|nr:hypothetical protein GJ744_006300 [Endocarpon pusillum]